MLRRWYSLVAGPCSDGVAMGWALEVGSLDSDVCVPLFTDVEISSVTQSMIDVCIAAGALRFVGFRCFIDCADVIVLHLLILAPIAMPCHLCARSTMP